MPIVELPRGKQIALGREHEVDGVTLGINRAIQVRPRAANPNIGFIDPPGITGTAHLRMRSLNSGA
jgi:hypothetical protein